MKVSVEAPAQPKVRTPAIAKIAFTLSCQLKDRIAPSQAVLAFGKMAKTHPPADQLWMLACNVA